MRFSYDVSVIQLHCDTKPFLEGYWLNRIKSKKNIIKLVSLVFLPNDGHWDIETCFKRKLNSFGVWVNWIGLFN